MADAKPSVFVGSSTDGLPIAEAIQRRLDYAAEVNIWNQATFDLSGVTIESLEEKCRESDFAIFVLTPDDVKIKREKETAAVRDNVIFELGLFAGTLGRRRCFLVHDRERKIDLPSDLAGITPATFSLQRSGDLDASLGAPCSAIAKAMKKQPLRPKLSAKALAAIEEISLFCARLTGYWWQRIVPDDASALSFVHVEPDLATNTVKMGGVAYHTDGAVIAEWETTSVSIDQANRRLSYIWEGSHPKRPDDLYQGFGSIKFDPAAEAFATGRGNFFNANLSDLKASRRKSMDMRRCSDEDIKTMTSNDDALASALVVEKLKPSAAKPQPQP